MIRTFSIRSLVVWVFVIGVLYFALSGMAESWGTKAHNTADCFTSKVVAMECDSSASR